MKVILYTKNFNEEINEKIDVILSPQFYWIKKINAKIDNINTARKIAKNMFDFNEKNYLFEAVEIEHKYFAVAIEKNIRFNFNKKYINSIRIAQTELYKFDCIKINNKEYLKKVDDIIFLLKGKSNCPYFHEIEFQLSKYKFNLNSINIDRNTIVLIFSAFIILNFYLISEIILTKKSINLLNKEVLVTLKKLKLPTTTFQLKSIYINLLTEFNKQTKLRKQLQEISHKNIRLYLIKFEKEKLILEMDKLIKFHTLHILSSQKMENKFRVIAK